MAKLPSGLTFSVTAYAHLDLATRIYVAIFTACFFTVDDKFAPGSDMSGLEMSRLLTRNGPFEDPAQETWFKLLLDTPEHYPHAPSASMIITSVTGFVNSLFLDNLMEGTKVSVCVHDRRVFLTMLCSSLLLLKSMPTTVAGSRDWVKAILFLSSRPRCLSRAMCSLYRT